MCLKELFTELADMLSPGGRFVRLVSYPPLFIQTLLYCIVCFSMLVFYNSGYSLIQTNIKQFQGLHKAVHLLH